MGNKQFFTKIELPGGIVLPDDLGSGGGASVHVGDDPPAGTPNDGALWIDTDEVTGDLMGRPIDSKVLVLPTKQVTATTAWETWGSSSIAFPSQGGGGLVTVHASVSGSFTAPPGSARLLGRCRVGISLDGGTTWTYGSEGRSETDRSGASIASAPLHAQHTVEGVPTGEIRVRAEVWQSLGTAGDITFAASGDPSTLQAFCTTSDPVVLDNRYAKATPTPRGILGWAEQSNEQLNIADPGSYITGLDVTVVLAEPRRLRIHSEAIMRFGVGAASSVFWAIHENGSEICRDRTFRNFIDNERWHVQTSRVRELQPGTYQFRAFCLVTASSARMEASAPAQLVVTDEGAF